MATLKAWVDIGLKGNLQEQSRRNAEAMKRFGRESNSALSGISAGIGSWATGLGAIAAGYLSIGAALDKVQKFATIEQRFARLAVNGRMTAGALDDLKKSIRETASLPEIQIKDDEILAAVEAIIEKTGDLKFAKDNLRTIGLAISATGASGADVGGLVSTALKLGLREREEIIRFVSTQLEQGKDAAFPLQKMATKGEKVFSAAASAGQRGESGAADTGALLQIAQMGTGDADVAATAYTSLITDLKNAEKQKLYKRLGVNVFTDSTHTKLRPIPDILIDTIEATKGDLVKLNRLYGEQSQYILNVLTSTIKDQDGIERTGIEVMQRMRRMRGSEELLAADSRRMAELTQATLDRSESIENEVIDTTGTRIKQELKGKSGIEWGHALLIATPLDIVEGVRESYRRKEKLWLGGPLPAHAPEPAPAPAPVAPAAPQELNLKLDHKVTFDGKRVTVKTSVTERDRESRNVMSGVRQ